MAGRGIADARNRAALGFQFITAGSDIGFLSAGAATALVELNGIRDGLKK